MVDRHQLVVILSCLISSGVYGIRFYLRVIMGKQLPAMEIFLIIATLIHITETGLEVYLLHVIANSTTPNDVMHGQLLFFIIAFFYLGGLWAVKMSVNCFHIRLCLRLPSVHNWAVRSLYFIACSWVAIYVVYMLGCIPVRRRWEWPLGYVQRCTPVQREWDFYVHSILNLSTDIWLGILPYRALLRIRERRLRVAVCGVYSLVCVIIVVSVLRLVLLAKDATPNIKAVIILSSIEGSVSIIVATIPGISSVFLQKYGRGKSRRRRGQSNSNYRKAHSHFNIAPMQGEDEAPIKLSFPSPVYANRDGLTTDSGEAVEGDQIHKMTTIEVTVTESIL